jgi:hypothetical protein
MLEPSSIVVEDEDEALAVTAVDGERWVADEDFGDFCVDVDDAVLPTLDLDL